MSTQHIVPLRIHFTVFTALMVLTAATVWVAFQDLGALNIVVALAIAAFKATLVMLFFMHLKYSSRLTQLFAACGFTLLAILIGITYSDFASRDWLSEPAGWAEHYSEVPASRPAP